MIVKSVNSLFDYISSLSTFECIIDCVFLLSMIIVMVYSLSKYFRSFSKEDKSNDR